MPVEYWEGNNSTSHPSQTGDVSEGGILLYLAQEREIGKRLRLRLFINSGVDFIPIEALGEVVWKDLPLGGKREHRIGVKFVDISEKDKAILKNFLSILMDLRKEPKLDIPPDCFSPLESEPPDFPFKPSPKR